MATQAGLGRDITTRKLEAHYLAGGDVPRLIRALIAAHRADLDLDFDRACAIDLAGRDVLDAVQTSVNPKVIDCPDSASGKTTLSAVAKNGVELKIRARVTVRTNLQQPRTNRHRLRPRHLCPRQSDPPHRADQHIRHPRQVHP